MTRKSDVSGRAERLWTRRETLRAGAAAVGAAVTVGVASGTQEETTETDEGTQTVGEVEEGRVRAVIPEQQQYDQTVTGFWIHIGPEVDPVESSVDDDCEFVDWSDEETLAYDAFLIDRSAEPNEQQITLYLHERFDIEAGTLFIVNNQTQCQSGYLGITIEQVGMDIAALRRREGATPTGDQAEAGGEGDGAAADGPGFGVVSSLAGVAGAGWLLRRRQNG
jgi:PGF-CTERM protein